MPLFQFLFSQMREAASVPVDEERSTRNFWIILNECIVYVAEAEGRIVGTLALRETAMTWYCPPEMVHRIDEWLVVEPNLRGSAGLALMKTAVEDGGGIPIIIRRQRNTAGRGVKADILGYFVGSEVQLR